MAKAWGKKLHSLEKFARGRRPAMPRSMSGTALEKVQRARRLARRLRQDASHEIARIRQWDRTTKRLACVMLLLGLLLTLPLLRYFFVDHHLRSRWFVPAWATLTTVAVLGAHFAIQEVRLHNHRHMEREPEAAKQLLHRPPGSQRLTGTPELLKEPYRQAHVSGGSSSEGSDASDGDNEEEDTGASDFESRAADTVLSQTEVQLVQAVMILQLLPESMVAKMMQLWTSYGVPHGTVIVRAGEPIRDFLVVKEGEVHLLDGQQRNTLQKIKPTMPATSYVTLMEWLAREHFATQNGTNGRDADGSPCLSPATLVAAADSVLLSIPLADLAGFIGARQDTLADAIRFVLFRLQRTLCLPLFQHVGFRSELLVAESDCADLAVLRTPPMPPRPVPKDPFAAPQTPSLGDNESPSRPQRVPKRGRSLSPNASGSDARTWKNLSPAVSTSSPIWDPPPLLQTPDNGAVTLSRREAAQHLCYALNLALPEDVLLVQDCVTIVTLQPGDRISFGRDGPRTSAPVASAVSHQRSVSPPRADSGHPSGRVVDLSSFLVSLQQGAVFGMSAGTLPPSLLEEKQAPQRLFTVNEGDAQSILNPLSGLTGEQVEQFVEAAQFSVLIGLRLRDFQRISLHRPSVLLWLVMCTIARLTPAARQLEMALRWTMLKAGQQLHFQGDSVEDGGLYVVLHGRLRTETVDCDQKQPVVTELGRNATIGEIEILSGDGQGWGSTVTAIRDTELCCVPIGLLRQLIRTHPAIIGRFCQLLVHKLRRTTSVMQRLPMAEWEVDVQGLSALSYGQVESFSTVALVPASPDVPLGQVAALLALALQAEGTTLHLSSSIVKSHLGVTADGMEKETITNVQLLSWLGVQEESHKFVVYEADPRNSAWTRRCVRQADILLVVGLARAGPGCGAVEAALADVLERCSARAEFVLLHTERERDEDGQWQRVETRRWMLPRQWTNGHHHLRLSDPIADLAARASGQGVDPASWGMLARSDFGRIARRIAGTSVGVVLGGGGAKGAAHLGVLQRLVEVGIPIDIIGGTSMGALVAGLYSMHLNMALVLRDYEVYCRKFNCKSAQLQDLTYPFTSIFAGESFNTLLSSFFHDVCIEDMWIPYFCITTNITTDTPMVHLQGTAWRYIRASMSLTTFLPPICDGPNLLVDGGYSNNMPADVAKSLGANFIVAVEVAAIDNTNYTNYGDSLSGWWLLWKKLPLPASLIGEPVHVPSMRDVSCRLVYLTGEIQGRRVKKELIDVYIKPKVAHINLLDFGSWESCMKIGYEATAAKFPADAEVECKWHASRRGKPE
eukprot:GGOE01023493.1.p1 GENE.GGOE01023493.1~~GGOE01023493.1.p1  ORF type:complete len:1339 (-),score=400.06 GGOE01023493.1:352-4251(-)